LHPTTIKQAYRQLYAGLKSAVEELVAKLCFLGYADTTVSFYAQGAVHFSFWLTKRRISPTQLKESHFTDFLADHQPMCECPFHTPPPHLRQAPSRSQTANLCSRTSPIPS
jgi:hypothetical protein